MVVACMCMTECLATLCVLHHNTLPPPTPQHQVNVHASTGQHSLQPVGVHCDVRPVSQVMVLPAALQPPAPSAVRRAVKLAEAAAAPLPIAPSSAPAAQQAQQQGVAGSSSAVEDMQQDQELQEQLWEEHLHAAAGVPSLPAAAVMDAETAQQVQQMVEAGLRGMCLDDRGAVVEIGWARQRTVPARWLHTNACMPLGGKAAYGSMHVVGDGGAGCSSRTELQPVPPVTQLLPGSPPTHDGVPLHWLVTSPWLSASGGGGCADASGAAASVVAAAVSGRVLHLQRLPAAEGRVLHALQRALLSHPLTRQMLLAAGADQRQDNMSCNTAAAAGALGACGVVDASVLCVLLVLPYRLQLLLLDSVVACGGVGGAESGVAAVGADEDERRLLVDGLRCRLQLLAAGAEAAE